MNTRQLIDEAIELTQYIRYCNFLMAKISPANDVYTSALSARQSAIRVRSTIINSIDNRGITQ